MTLLHLATRNLSRNRRRTAISLMALVICIAAMIAMRGMLASQQTMVVENFVSGQLGAVQIHRAGYLANVQGSPLQLDIEDSPELRAKIASVRGVTAVAPRIAFGAMISTPDKAVEGRDPTEDELGRTSFFFATAIDPVPERVVAPKRWDWMGKGRIFESADASALVLNGEFAADLSAAILAPGQPLPPETEWLAVLAADRDGALNGENVLLSGVTVAATPGDRKVGLVPLTTAQRLLRMEGRVTEYALALEDFGDAARVRDELRQVLGPQYEVHTWDEVLPFIKHLLENSALVFNLVTAVFLLVVLLGIVNVMLMNVLERIREIGTMMAVGVRRSQIVRIFLLEGAILGALGAAIGSVVGFLIILFLNRRGIELPAPGSSVASVLRPWVEPSYYLRMLLMGSLGSALAAVYPAFRASRLRPVEALQSP